jgi:hypothetical protein
MDILFIDCQGRRGLYAIRTASLVHRCQRFRFTKTTCRLHSPLERDGLAVRPLL